MKAQFLFLKVLIWIQEVLGWGFCLKWTTFVLLILMWSSQHSHQEWSALSIHWRSSSVSDMRAMSSANMRRARNNSPQFTPKPSFFISSIRPLMKRLNKVGESRQPCLTWYRSMTWRIVPAYLPASTPNWQMKHYYYQRQQTAPFHKSSSFFHPFPFLQGSTIQ